MSTPLIANALIVLYGLWNARIGSGDNIDKESLLIDTSSIRWQHIMLFKPTAIIIMLRSLQFFNDPITFLATFLIPVLFGIQLAKRNICLNQVPIIIGCHVVALCFGCRFWGKTVVPPNSVYLTELEMHGQWDAFLRTFLWSVWFSLLLSPALKKVPFLLRGAYGLEKSFISILFKDKEFISLVIGCWIGCIVIPLDWGRSWQLWPVPNIIAGSFSVLFYKLYIRFFG